METAKSFLKEELKKLLDKPLDKRIVALVSEIERRPALYIDNDISIRCLFHFLNGWQMAVFENRDPMEVCLNEKMNAFLALKYEDFGSLNWEYLLIRHEGENAAFGKFFEYFHLMENQ